MKAREDRSNAILRNNAVDLPANKRNRCRGGERRGQLTNAKTLQCESNFGTVIVWD